MRKSAPRRRVIVAMPPRGLRPQLTGDQVIDLSLCHYSNLDAVATGLATELTLWNLAEAALTWSRVAEMLGAGEPEMRQALELVGALVSRYGVTGRIEFVGNEYRTATDAAAHMDLLAAIVDAPTAIAAAVWSNRKVFDLEAACKRGAAALVRAGAELPSAAVAL